ncbi:MAG: leucine-rich repeat domain-containing protein [Lachnospiraceae bacterium]|nr:leucine-rich repeat domain-containing protein [Lachnospiraceae bacterium]
MCKQTKKRNGFLGILLTLAMVFTLLPVVPAKAATYQLEYRMLKAGDNDYKTVGKMPFTTDMTLSSNNTYAFNEDQYYPMKESPSVLPAGYDTYIEYAFPWYDNGNFMKVSGTVGPIAAPTGYDLKDAKIIIPNNSMASSVTIASSSAQGNTYKVVSNKSTGDWTFFLVAYKKAGSASAQDSGNTDSKLPAVKDKLDAKDGSATYEVTKSANGAVEVAYTGPSAAQKKKTSITVKGQVTLKDGTKAKVTSVAPKAFKGNKKVKTIILDKNIVKVGKDACKGCTSLTTLTIKNKNIKIAAKAFKNAGKKGKKVKVVYPKAIKKGKALTKFKKMIKNAGLKKVTYKAK